MKPGATSRFRKDRAHRPRHAAPVRPAVECLEDRLLLTAGGSLGDALDLSLVAAAADYRVAQVADFLANEGSARFFRVELDSPQLLTISVDSAPYGGALDSYLRVFQDDGRNGWREIAANDNWIGANAGMTIQASGVLYIGISSFDNREYDPTQAHSGSGSSFGMFDLRLECVPAGPAALPVVAWTSASETALQWGQAFTVHYTLENRGELDAGPLTLSLLASATNQFADNLPPLSSVEISGLAAGETFSGSFEMTLGADGVPPDALAALQRVFLGLQLGAALPQAPVSGNDWTSATFLVSDAVAEEADLSDLGSAYLLTLDSQTSRTLPSASDADYFKVELTQSGTLFVSIDAAGAPVSLTLYDGAGNPIVHSAGTSLAIPGPSLSHRLLGAAEGTTYYLRVSRAGDGAIDYELTTRFTPTDSDLYVVDVGSQIQSLGHGDFNGDGVVDVVTLSSGADIWLGNGDGSFHRSATLSDGLAMQTQAVGDFNGDGRLDIVVSAAGADGLRIFLGNGDGTFADAVVIDWGGELLASGDFNGDGHLDFVRAGVDFFANTVTVYLGDGTGAFRAGDALAVEGYHGAIGVADFNGDGRSDVVLGGDGIVWIFLSDETGALTLWGAFDVTLGPVTALTIADWNGDGRFDVAAAGENSASLALLWGDGAGGLTVTSRSLEAPATALEAADINGDGRVDLALTTKAGVIAVYLGTAEGFAAAPWPTFVGAATALAAADFDGDGRVDLAVAEFGNRFFLLHGNGDGSFPRYAADLRTGTLPLALVTGDFDGDGFLDMASANAISGDVSVFLGNGDSTFRFVGSLDVGELPKRLIAGDFNGDGRLDLVAANYLSQSVSVLLGNGDGSFQPEVQYALPGYATGLVAGDFDEDFQLDIAAALGFTADGWIGNSVAVLRGVGDGTFAEPEVFETGWWPKDLVAGDFDGDGHLDLATANYDYYGQDVTVLRGDGTGRFETPVASPKVGFLQALVSGDFDGDGDLDFASVNSYPSSVVILRNDGGLQYTAVGAFDMGTRVTALVAGDFNGDGVLDLAVTSDFYRYYYNPADHVRVLLGNGDCDFTMGEAFATGSGPVALVTGDFNGDSRADLAVASQNDATITTLVGSGTGSFASARIATSAIQSTPLLVQFSPGSTVDAVVLTETGAILLRRGLADVPGAFDAPVVVNPDPTLAARDIALVKQADGQTAIAALDAHTASAGGDAVSQVSLYTANTDGTFTRTVALVLPAGVLPTRIFTADLNGDQLDDLVIVTALTNQVFVAIQLPSGEFAGAVAYDVGVNPSAVEFAPVNSDAFLDMIVVNRFSGQISVLINDGNGAFAMETRYRADIGAYDLAALQGDMVVQSLASSIGVVSGDFDGAAGTDLVVLHAGTSRFSLLSGTGHDGFLNPAPAGTTSLPTTPTAVVAGYFAGSDDILDLAILSQEAGTVSIFRGDGAGGFTLTFVASAGNAATGLAVGDVTSPNGGGPDGVSDLLVGNVYGDLLILAGVGDGTFSTYRRGTPSLSLASALSADGDSVTFFFSDYSSDRLSQQTVAVGTVVVDGADTFQDRDAGIYAPGPEHIVTVGATSYLVVANSGANQLLIYTLDADNQPILASKQVYYTGTNPTAFVVTDLSNDLNQDGIPDVVVANQGSNDVSVFLGGLTGETWTLTYRPRQSSGGVGPTSVVVADVVGAGGLGGPDGIADVLVSNAQSGGVEILPNRGDGFLVSQPAPLPLLDGFAARSLFVGNFDGFGGLDLVALDANSTTVVLVQNFATAPLITSISSAAVPYSAVVADINRDAISDLLVANASDGIVQSFLGGAGGLTLGDSFQVDALVYLTDLALVQAGDRLDLYGADAAGRSRTSLARLDRHRNRRFFCRPVPAWPKDSRFSPWDLQPPI